MRYVLLICVCLIYQTLISQEVYESIPHSKLLEFKIDEDIYEYGWFWDEKNKNRIPCFRDYTKNSLKMTLSLKYTKKYNTTQGTAAITIVNELKKGVANATVCGYFDGSFYTNGIDDVFLKYDFTKDKKNKKVIITYAGNIGEGQGLEKIVPDMARKLGNEYEIHIIGDGGRKKV